MARTGLFKRIRLMVDLEGEGYNKWIEEAERTEWERAWSELWEWRAWSRGWEWDSREVL